MELSTRKYYLLGIISRDLCQPIPIPGNATIPLYFWKAVLCPILFYLLKQIILAQWLNNI